MKSQLDYLDRIAVGCVDPEWIDTGFGVLSTGEKLYVALAANRADLLALMGCTMAQAVVRIGDDWTRELTRRWQYGTPAHAL